MLVIDNNKIKKIRLMGVSIFSVLRHKCRGTLSRLLIYRFLQLFKACHPRYGVDEICQ